MREREREREREKYRKRDILTIMKFSVTNVLLRRLATFVHERKWETRRQRGNKEKERRKERRKESFERGREEKV